MIEFFSLCRWRGGNLRGPIIGFGFLDRFLGFRGRGLSLRHRLLPIIGWTRTQKKAAYRLRQFHQTSFYFQRLHYKDVPVHLIGP